MNIFSRFVFIIIFSFSGIFLLSTIVHWQLKKYQSHTSNRLNEILNNSTDFDILFIGSSRTHTSINPRIIDSVVKSNSYNAGVEGGNLLEFKMIFDAYLINHPPPKVLVLTLDLNSFDLKRPFFNYTNYLDYLNNKIIDSTLCANNHNTTLFKIFPFAKITEYDDFSKGNAIKAIFKKGNEIGQDEFEYKGYLSNSYSGITPNTIKFLNYVNYPVSDTAIQFLKNIIKICSEKRIKVLLTYAPEYNVELKNHTTNKSDIINVIEKIASDSKISLYRDDSLNLCKNSKLFLNYGHLNTMGASEYSVILARRLIFFFSFINLDTILNARLILLTYKSSKDISFIFFISFNVTNNTVTKKGMHGSLYLTKVPKLLVLNPISPENRMA